MPFPSLLSKPFDFWSGLGAQNEATCFQHIKKNLLVAPARPTKIIKKQKQTYKKPKQSP
mgnify:CR=1 FL=1